MVLAGRVSEAQNAEAVLALINAALNPRSHAYDVDAIPETRPADYVEVSVSRRYGGSPRLDGLRGAVGWRVTARAVSTNVANARLMHEKTRAALEYRRVVAGGRTSTPVQFETSEPVGPDDGWFSGLTSYTYTI